MDYFVADIRKNGLEVEVVGADSRVVADRHGGINVNNGIHHDDGDERPRAGLSFKWVHGDVSHMCAAIVERFADLATLRCPLCNGVFENVEGRPRDLLFTHLQEVHFSYEYGCIYRCSTCRLQFATSRNAAAHLGNHPKHTLKCALCRAVLEKAKIRSHFAGEHVMDFCAAIEDELIAAGLDDVVAAIRAYASVRRNNRTITSTDVRRFEKTPLHNADRNLSLICGQICEFDCGNLNVGSSSGGSQPSAGSSAGDVDCCLIHQKYKKVYERYCRRRDGVFRCPMCLKAYVNMPAVGIGHLILEHSLQLLSHRYECRDCPERFNDVFRASDHVAAGHVLYCTLCCSLMCDVPAVREHLNRLHSSLVMEVTDRLLRVNPERSAVDELTALCYRDGALRCVRCAIRLPAADAEQFENHVILNHLGMRPMRCKLCGRPCTDEESRRHVHCCRVARQADQSVYFTCNVDGCEAPSEAIAAHFKQSHWDLVRPVVERMLERARILRPEWAFATAALRDRVAPIQLMLSTVSPNNADERCCQQLWPRAQNLLEHIVSQHASLDQPWFLFRVATVGSFGRLACSLCERPVFETTWVCHVLERHRPLLQDVLDRRLSEVLSLCGFAIEFTSIGDQMPVAVKREQALVDTSAADDDLCSATAGDVNGCSYDSRASEEAEEEARLLKMIAEDADPPLEELPPEDDAGDVVIEGEMISCKEEVLDIEPAFISFPAVNGLLASAETIVVVKPEPEDVKLETVEVTCVKPDHETAAADTAAPAIAAISRSPLSRAPGSSSPSVGRQTLPSEQRRQRRRERRLHASSTPYVLANAADARVTATRPVGNKTPIDELTSRADLLLLSTFASRDPKLFQQPVVFLGPKLDQTSLWPLSQDSPALSPLRPPPPAAGAAAEDVSPAAGRRRAVGRLPPLIDATSNAENRLVKLASVVSRSSDAALCGAGFVSKIEEGLLLLDEVET